MQIPIIPDKGRGILGFGAFELRKFWHWVAPVLATAAVGYVVAHGAELQAKGGLYAVVAAVVTLAIRMGWLVVKDNRGEQLQ